MLIGRDAIAALIPHAGAMCLLDAVVEWNAQSIRCTTNSHRDPRNPLRRDGHLAAVHLAEYGAQAMAIHGGLCAAPGRAPPGMLAGVRELVLECEHVDGAAELTVSARQRAASAGGWLYEFEVRDAARQLAAGRVSVIHTAMKETQGKSP